MVNWLISFLSTTVKNTSTVFGNAFSQIVTYQHFFILASRDLTFTYSHIIMKIRLP